MLSCYGLLRKKKEEKMIIQQGMEWNGVEERTSATKRKEKRVYDGFKKNTIEMEVE
jgi:hypothetical protein